MGNVVLKSIKLIVEMVQYWLDTTLQPNGVSSLKYPYNTMAPIWHIRLIIYEIKFIRKDVIALKI